MTCTTLVDCIPEILVGYSGHGKAECGPAPRTRLHRYLTTVAFDDGARNRQADAHSVAFGRDERLKELIHNFGSDARPTVGNADLDEISAPRATRDDQF